MTLTLLLDLDDTLLNTHQEVFVPAYFEALSTQLAPQIAPKLMAQALFLSTEAMNRNQDFFRTLREVFDDVFYPKVDLPRDSLREEINQFYDRVFPTLQGVTSQNPQTKSFIDWARKKGYRLVIATDPLLPKAATWHRLRWAGLDPEWFELVSTYEDFHFSKTFSAYYAEVLGRIGWPDGPVLMVGNDWERDVLPAQQIGLATYFVTHEKQIASEANLNPRGDLTDLQKYLEEVDPAALLPSLKKKKAVEAIFSSTPAVMDTLLRRCTSWNRSPASNEWTLTELICHLRDTEREVHHMQLKILNEQIAPFIPRPDTSVWANQRDYLHEDGAAALVDFVAARQTTLSLLRAVPPENWERKARHAIFGPTDFLEVLSFMAEHDRLHVQQALSLIRKL